MTSPTESADLVFFYGTILTVDDTQSTAEAIAVSGWVGQGTTFVRSTAA